MSQELTQQGETELRYHYGAGAWWVPFGGGGGGGGRVVECTITPVLHCSRPGMANEYEFNKNRSLQFEGASTEQYRLHSKSN